MATNDRNLGKRFDQKREKEDRVKAGLPGEDEPGKKPKPKKGK